MPLVTLETIDNTVKKYFDEKLNISVETERGRRKASVLFAAGERWKLTREDLRDENGILILPLISIKRVNIDRTPGSSAMVREVPYVTVKKNIHQKTPNIQNLVDQKQKSNFPQKKIIPVEEYLTIPFPDFCTVFYEITIWTQYQVQMNEILEKIFYNYDYLDSFAMHTDYNNGVGQGYRFVGYRDGNVTPQTNVEEFSAEERILKYVYTIKVPVYLMLDPKDETLAYGREKTNTKNDKNTKIVHKSQNVVAVKLKEGVIGAGVIDKLKAADIDLFNDQQDKARQELLNLLSQGGGGGGGGGSVSFDTSTPRPIALVGDPGSSGKFIYSDHVHAHGNLPGGTLHDLVSITGSGFAPTLAGVTDNYILAKTGNSASWIQNLAASNTPVTGSDNFFINQILTVSGSIVNPIGDLILSSSQGSYVVVSGSLAVLDESSIMTRGKIYNDTGHLILSSSTQITTSGSIVIKPHANAIGLNVVSNGAGNSNVWAIYAVGAGAGSNSWAIRAVGGSGPSGNGSAAIYATGGGTGGGGILADAVGGGTGAAVTSPSGFGLTATSTTGTGAKISSQGANSTALILSGGAGNSYPLTISGSSSHSASIRNLNSDLILSASTSTITVSGNLKVTGDISSNNLDSRYVLTSSFVIYTGSIYQFTASQNSLNDAINGFTASFSSSVQSIGDARYVRAVNEFSGNISIVAGPNITINSGSGQIVITGSAVVDTTALNEFSQSVNIFTASINLFTQSLPTQQTGEIIISVSTAGSDINASRPKLKSGSYTAYPFRTFQAAFDKLAQDTNRTLNYDVYITASAGTFDGFNIEGFTGNGEITVAGTYITTTLTSGSLSGTAGTGTTSTVLYKPTRSTKLAIWKL